MSYSVDVWDAMPEVINNWQAKTDWQTVCRRNAGRKHYNSVRTNQRGERRCKVAQLLCVFGFHHGAYTAIARKLGVHRCTICRDVAYLLQGWTGDLAKARGTIKLMRSARSLGIYSDPREALIPAILRPSRDPQNANEATLTPGSPRDTEEYRRRARGRSPELPRRRRDIPSGRKGCRRSSEHAVPLAWNR